MMASKSWVKSHWYQISKRQILYQEDGGSTDQIERDIKALVETLVQDGLCTDPIETINFLHKHNFDLIYLGHPRIICLFKNKLL